jgi:hypothetical protein
LTDLGLKTFNKLYPMMIRKYQDLIVDQNASEADKINQIIFKLNSLGKLSNDVVRDWNTVYQWAMNDGLATDVSNKVEAMRASGELDTVLQSVFNALTGDMTTLHTNAKDTTVNAINEVDDLAKANQTKMGDLTTLQTADKDTLVHAINDNVAQMADIMTLKPSGGDDSTTIQNAVNNLPDGGILEFKGGSYTVNNVTITKNITLRGRGKVTFTRTTNNVSILSITGTGTEEIIIDNIKFEGNSYKYSGITISTVKTFTMQNSSVAHCGINGYAVGNRTGVDGVRISNTDTAKFFNCNISYCERDGIGCFVARNLIVENCEISFCGRIGSVNDGGAYSNQIYSTRYFQNYVHDCGAGGLHCENANTGIFANLEYFENLIEDCGNDDWGYGWGLVMGTYTKGKCSENVVSRYNMTNKTNYLHAISITYPRGIEITHNQIVDCGGRGLDLQTNNTDSYNFVRAIGNTIKNVTLEGIFAYNINNFSMSGVEIKNNYIENAGRDGINCNFCVNSLVEGNKVLNCSSTTASTYYGITMTGTIKPTLKNNYVSGSNHKLDIFVDLAYIATVTLENCTYSTINMFQGTGNITSGKKRINYSSIPTAGKYNAGDLVYNTSPVASGYIGWVCITAGTANNTSWTATTAYSVGAVVNANGKVYTCTVAGTSGSTAPSHTSGTATDGTVTWQYSDALSVFKGYGAIQA